MPPPGDAQSAVSSEPPAARQVRRSRRRRIERAACWVHPEIAAESGVADSEALTSLLRAVVVGSFEPERWLKAEHRSEVVQFLHGDRRWVLKRYRGTALRTRLLHAVRQSPAWREWRAARSLAEHGIRGCPPLALIHEPSEHESGCTQALLLPHVEGERLQDVIRGDGSPDRLDRAERDRRLALARAVGRQAGLISGAGLANRDHKPTNLLIDAPCRERGEQPVLIDPIGLRRRRTEGPVWRMLAQLRRTAQKAGPISLREQLTCLRAVLRADPGLLRGRRRRLRWAAVAVDRARSAAGRSSGADPGDRG